MDRISGATSAFRASATAVALEPANQALPRVRVAELPAPTAVTQTPDPRLAPPQVTARPAPQTFPTPTVKAAYETIAGSYIEAIDARQLTLAGVRGLSRLEPAIGAELVGDTLRVSWSGAPMLEVPLGDGDLDTQLAAARRVVQEVAQRSHIVADRTPAELTQLYVFGMKSQLDIYTRYLTQQELAQTYARLGVASGPSPVTVRRIERNDVPSDTAIVGLTAFGEHTPDELARLLGPLVDSGVTKVVIDLRGVGGGIVASAARAADLFLAAGRTLDLRARDAQYTARADAAPNSPLERLQIVLVVDGATASAAEDFAATLGDLGHAVLLGRATYSKGRAQAIVPLPSGEGLSLSVGELVGPTAARIHGVGLMPAVCADGEVSPATYATLARARRVEVTQGRAMITNACAAAPGLSDRALDEAVRLLRDASAFAQARERQRALAGVPDGR